MNREHFPQLSAVVTAASHCGCFVSDQLSHLADKTLSRQIDSHIPVRQTFDTHLCAVWFISAPHQRDTLVLSL